MWNKPGTDFPIKTPSPGGRGKGEGDSPPPYPPPHPKHGGLPTSRGRESTPETAGHGRLLIISGPSGSGKTSICGELEKDPGVRKSISVTTRPPRPQEQEGRDYYFVSEEEFKKKIGRGEFVEYATYSGHLYGTPLKPLKKAMEEGVIYLLEIDVQGAQQVLKKFPEAISIFILPPHEEELAVRIKGRNLQPDLQGRLAIAREEIKLADQYKYRVVNDVLERAVKEIRQILELDK